MIPDLLNAKKAVGAGGRNMKTLQSIFANVTEHFSVLKTTYKKPDPKVYKFRMHTVSLKLLKSNSILPLLT